MGAQEKPKRLSRAEAQARTRLRLLDAARVIFARRGYQAATVEEIAAEAGHTSGAVYSNFGSKEELFLALRAHMGENRIAEAAAQLAAGGDDPQFRGLSETLLGREDDEILLDAEFWLFAVRHPDRVIEFHDQLEKMRDDLVGMMTAQRERWGLKWPVSDTTATVVVLAMYMGLTRQRYLNPKEVPPELFGRALNWLIRGLIAEGMENGADRPRED